MQNKREKNILVSLGSLANATRKIKHLLGHSENKMYAGSDSKETCSEETCSEVVKYGSVVDSPADIDKIFSIELNLSDIDQVKKQESFVQDKFKEFFKYDNGLLNGFIWVEISSEGEVVVVGKSSSTEKSDLFLKYSILTGGTVRELITRFCSQEDQEIIQRCDNQINQKVMGAVIIPVKSNQKTDDKERRKYLNEVETQIGKQIVKEYGAFNSLSHNY